MRLTTISVFAVGIVVENNLLSVSDKTELELVKQTLQNGFVE